MLTIPKASKQAYKKLPYRPKPGLTSRFIRRRMAERDAIIRPGKTPSAYFARKKNTRELVIKESGALVVGKTKGGELLYGPPKVGVFKARDLQYSLERAAHYSLKYPKRRARRFVGL